VNLFYSEGVMRMGITHTSFRKWRRSHDITQKQIAEALKVSKSAICKFEQGKLEFSPFTYERLEKFIQKEELEESEDEARGIVNLHWFSPIHEKSGKGR